MAIQISDKEGEKSRDNEVHFTDELINHEDKLIIIFMDLLTSL